MFTFIKIEPSCKYTILSDDSFDLNIRSKILTSPNTTVIGRYKSLFDMCDKISNDYEFIVVNKKRKGEFSMTKVYNKNAHSLYVFDRKGGVIREVIFK